MGWEKGRYYTRSKKVNGQVIREYCGCGELGELAHQIDLEERAEGEAKRKGFAAMQIRDNELDAQVSEYSELAETLSRGLLIAAGYHQHKLGEWRKRRVQK